MRRHGLHTNWSVGQKAWKVLEGHCELLGDRVGRFEKKWATRVVQYDVSRCVKLMPG